MAVTEKSAQVALLVIGLLMALAGGALKISTALAEPGDFGNALFSGAEYLPLMLGLALVILALGYDRLFGPDDPEGQW